jgi:hypothetical protein
MGVFDSLIENGQEPKVEVEYIYSLDMAWPIYDVNDKRATYMHNSVWDEGSPKKFSASSQEELDAFEERPYSIKVKKYIIVTDVESKKREDGYHLGYDFTIKDSGIRCHCNYPWAFWENTPENLVKINEYRMEQKKLNEQKKLVEKLRNNIDQLSIKDENE